MRLSLPTTVTLGEKEYAICSDYRDILSIFDAIENTEDLTEEERAVLVLALFYEEYETIPPAFYKEAIAQCFLFINGGEKENERRAPKLVDWAKDIRYIIAPINRVMGQEIRSVPYMHWWTFLSAYMEIGDCLFAQIVRIRDQKARGKKLSKEDAQWYKENRDLVDMKSKYTSADMEMIKAWI